MMSFEEWVTEAQDDNAVQYRRRIQAGEQGNPYNPVLAAQHAYNAGIQEGLRLASVRLDAALRGRIPAE